MFGKKKKQNVEKTVSPDVEIHTIPDVFYGGQDPQIYKQQVSQDTTKKKTLGADTKKRPPRSMVSQKTSQTKTGLFSNKLFVGGMIALVVLGGGAITWYYVADYQRAQDELARQQAPVIQEPDEVETTTPTTTVEVVTTTPEIETPVVTTTPDALDVFVEFPPLLTLDTSDIDADDLTDIEEELFNTDSGTWDSDADGYYDGQEVYNLYNPRGFAPVKIIDSGLVREYINPAIGYRVYYPASWQQGSVDVAEQQVLFSSISGDYIEVRIVEKDTLNQSFISWFGRYAEGQRYTDVSAFTNRFKFDGFERQDSLVAYFHNQQHVVVMVYHPRDRGPIAYRNVMKMMYQSFRMQPTNIDIPDQDIFPGVTSTLDITTTTDDLDETMTTTTDALITDDFDSII